MAHEELLEAARAVRLRAHAPYSLFKVGAAVRADDGRIYSGCNVESSSYGLSICAERAAIARAIAEGATEVLEVAVVADTPTPVSPCGACRQVISDLGPRALVIMADLQGHVETHTIDALLPGAFRADHLPAKGR